MVGLETISLVNLIFMASGWPTHVHVELNTNIQSKNVLLLIDTHVHTHCTHKDKQFSHGAGKLNRLLLKFPTYTYNKTPETYY